MAKSSKSSSDQPNVTRIKASDDGEKKKSAKAASQIKAAKPAKSIKATKVTTAKRSRRDVSSIRGLGWLASIGGYFKGAWYELRQVIWPTRGATWSLTGAVLAFSAFFIVFILLLDAGFNYVFQLILK